MLARKSSADIFDIVLTVLDSVIYSGRYHSRGTMLGEIGGFCKQMIKLETERLCLRDYVETDFEAYYKLKFVR